MNDAEYLAWCKRRAHEYLDQGAVANAITSMLSDLSKRPSTEVRDASLMHLGIVIARDGDVEAARRFIDGFRA